MLQATEVLSLLYAAHQEGKKTVGVDIEAAGAGVRDAQEAGILDLYLAKFWGIKFATTAACTVLKVDQVGARGRLKGTCENWANCMYLKKISKKLYFCV